MTKEELHDIVFSKLKKHIEECYDFSTTKYKDFEDAYDNNSYINFDSGCVLSDMEEQRSELVNESILNDRMWNSCIFWFELESSVSELEKIGCKKIKDFSIY